ncbi:restriction endonuclease subunit S [Shewanella sp. PP-He15 brown]
MSTDNKVPEIRFKGFSGEWCNSELKSLCNSFSYGLNASAIKFDGVNKYLRITDIDEKNRHFASSALTSPDADLSKSNDYLLKNGDILFARTGASVGKTYIYNEQDGKVYFAGFLIRASVNDKTNAQFIFQNTHTHEYAKFVTITSQRSGQPGINAKEYSEYQLFTPEEKEQAQIGNYFQKLDSLINQHQQKHDKLCNIKKAMLEKMFPKQGETIPEIRFKGFSGEWEERAICDLFTVTRGNVLAATKTSPVPTPDKCFPVYSSQTKNNGLMGFYDRYLFESAITWTTDGANAGTVNFREGKFYSTNVNGVLLSDEGYANKAVAEILNKEAWKHVSHVGNPKLMNNVMSAIKITVPNSAEEQTAIGNTFQKLDALINQHQQQITKLNNIKQACLSKMFV